MEDTRDIVKNLVIKTDSREIKWVSTFENSEKVIFNFTKIITEKKRLIFNVILRRDKFLSELNINFGQIGHIKSIINIDIKKQPLLYDLLDSLQIKYNDGDIHNIDNINREINKINKEIYREYPILKIAKEQNKPYDQITLLECYNRNFTSLDGIENLINLKYLLCYKNRLTNLNGIENLINLELLACYDNQLTNLDGIENLINLKFLNCSSNQLTNLNGIENLINLETFYCYSNQLTNLNEIENLINLKYLYCYNNNLTNLNGIENLINLKTLYCKNNNFSNDYKNYLKNYCKKKNIYIDI